MNKLLSLVTFSYQRITNMTPKDQKKQSHCIMHGRRVEKDKLCEHKKHHSSSVVVMHKIFYSLFLLQQITLFNEVYSVIFHAISFSLESIKIYMNIWKSVLTSSAVFFVRL